MGKVNCKSVPHSRLSGVMRQNMWIPVHRICFILFRDISLNLNTVEPHYNEVIGTMKITLLYQVSHYIRVKKQRNIKSWDQQNYLVIRGFCYIRPLYNEVPLYSIQSLLTFTECRYSQLCPSQIIAYKVKGLFKSSSLYFLFFTPHKSNFL